MSDIDNTLLLLITAMTRDVKDIDADEVVIAWRTYKNFWPDDARAMGHLQKVLLEQCIDEFNENYVIKFGQYMENLSWSFKKRNGWLKTNLGTGKSASRS